MADAYDENACPNRRTAGLSSVKHTDIKSSRHKICNNNNNDVSPVKRQTNVAKLAALYDNTNNGTPTTPYKQQPRRIPQSSAEAVYRQKSKATHRSAFDDKRDDGRRSSLQNSQLQNKLLVDKQLEISHTQTISSVESNIEVLDKANDINLAFAAKENEVLKVDEKCKAPQQDAVAKQAVISTIPNTNCKEDKATPSCSTIKADDTSSSSVLDKDTNTTSQQQLPPAMKYISQAILLLLSLYEVQHYYHLIPTTIVLMSNMTGWSQHYHNSTSTTAATTITDAVSNWTEALHIGFVLSFYIRALVVSATMTKQSMSKNEKRNGEVSLYTPLVFLFIAICWVTILPIFRDDCGSKACFFIERTDTHHILKVSNPRYSILDLLLTKWYKSMRLLIRIKIKSRVRKEVQRALLSPFGIHGRLKKLFTVIRWSKFLAPLIGTCNK